MQNRRFVFRMSLALIVTGIVLVGNLPIGIAYLYMNTMLNRACGNLPTPIPDHLPDAEIQSVRLNILPEADLDGWFVAGQRDAVVILLPGAWGGRDSMYDEFIFLHNDGYGVLTYGTRHCANPPTRGTLGYTETADLITALDWLEDEIQPASIAVLGYSQGGSTAIFAAAQDPRIEALITIGNYADLHYDVRRITPERRPPWLENWMRGWIQQVYEWQTGIPLEDVRPIAVIDQISPRPILLIHGQREIDSSRGREQFAAANEPKELWIVPNAGHGQYLRVAETEYITRILAFLNEHLPHD